MIYLNACKFLNRTFLFSPQRFYFSLSPSLSFSHGNSLSTNLSCNCGGASYLPVCADGQAYFSPCHAGCQAETPTVSIDCCCFCELLGSYLSLQVHQVTVQQPCKCMNIMNLHSPEDYVEN